MAMYYNDHSPPHFHAIYAGQEARIAILGLELREGSLPRRAQALVQEWARLHQAELHKDWEKARDGLPLDRIEGPAPRLLSVWLRADASRVAVLDQVRPRLCATTPA